MKNLIFTLFFLASGLAQSADLKSLAGVQSWELTQNSRIQTILKSTTTAFDYSQYSVSSGSELIAGRYLILKGCKPRACAGNEYLAIIDTENEAAVGLVKSDAVFESPGRIYSVIKCVNSKWLLRYGSFYGNSINYEVDPSMDNHNNERLDYRIVRLMSQFQK